MFSGGVHINFKVEATFLLAYCLRLNFRLLFLFSFIRNASDFDRVEVFENAVPRVLIASFICLQSGKQLVAIVALHAQRRRNALRVRKAWELEGLPRLIPLTHEILFPFI